MNLQDITDLLGLEVIAGGEHLQREVACGYVSDLLSDVMGHAPEGAIWVTLQIHQNVVAIALLRSLVAVVLVGGRKPPPEVIDRAKAEGVVLLGSDMTSFELVGRLYKAGVRA
jgi:serine kinase of HPr protein (carbohydrate metabolism regulator)